MFNNSIKADFVRVKIRNFCEQEIDTFLGVVCRDSLMARQDEIESVTINMFICLILGYLVYIPVNHAYLKEKFLFDKPVVNIDILR